VPRRDPRDLSLVTRYVGWCGNCGIALFVANRRIESKMHRNDAGPDGQVVVGIIVDRRTRADLGGNFGERETQNAGGFLLFFTGFTRVVPATRKKFLGECVEGFELFLRLPLRHCSSKGNDGAVVHGMIEDGAREDKAVGERDGDANGNPITEIAKHAAGRGAVEIESITHTSEKCGNDVGLAVHGKSDMAHEGFIENLVDAFAIVDAALRLAHHARSLGRRKSFGHGTPH